MLEVVFLISLAIVWLIFASVCDLKSREIPNWLSFSLIVFVLGFRFFYSLFSGEGFDFFFMGLIGGGIFFGLANLFYYGRMFAGGDAKLLMALGVVLPFSTNLFFNLQIFIGFLFLFLFIGGIYGLIWGFVLSIVHFKEFKKEFVGQFQNNKISILFSIGFCFFVFFFGFYNYLFFYIGLIGILFLILFVSSKSIEEVCLVKNIGVKNLTEGDWLYKDIKIGRRTIKSSWDGLTKKDINFIRRHKRKIKIKYGIPFVPVFLIAFLILVWLWFNDFSLWNSIF